MADDLVVLDGSTFFVSDRSGDLVAPTDGFYFADMRHLSRWKLMVDGEPIRVLTSRTLEYWSARVVATVAETRVGVNPPLSLHRDRVVGGGVHEDLRVENHGASPASLVIEFDYGADFADLFEVKDSVPPSGHRDASVEDQRVRLHYDEEGYGRSTEISFSQAGEVGPNHARFHVDLGPRSAWAICIDIVPVADAIPVAMRAAHPSVTTLPPAPQMPGSLENWLGDVPQLEGAADRVAHTYRQSLVDLASLRFRPDTAIEWSVPAAGLPWFMALFGRDSLITSYMALPFQSHLASATLQTLASLQAVQDDPFRDAQPGKILHELRLGKLTVLGRRPHGPYYGTHDATPLFLILLDEYERWTADTALVSRLEPAARAAMAWIDGPGDPDQDGYLEYETRSTQGLVNQCWKDSWNSMLFADGQVAKTPIATCEIQGYAYDARRRTARLAREVWGDPLWAAQLDAAADALGQRFNRDFWDPQRNEYVLALDATKRPVDSLTSNAGHLLWSGIVPADRAKGMAATLTGAVMNSGWGVRTMSPGNAGYNPIEYHNGTVWPHDTAIVAEGLRRYGYRTEAAVLAGQLFEAAEAFGYRLPEVFAGFDRAETVVPVEYPTASRPQAWSSATPLLALRTVLDLDARDGHLTASPPTGAFQGLRLTNVLVRGRREDTP